MTSATETRTASRFVLAFDRLRVGWNGELRFKCRRLKLSNALQNLDVVARRAESQTVVFDFFYAHHRFMTLDLNIDIHAS